ncbi:hypothetical protein [Pelagibius marinus]|nr:hypothetical protein [Pelagibius marinus]
MCSSGPSTVIRVDLVAADAIRALREEDVELLTPRILEEGPDRIS